MVNFLPLLDKFVELVGYAKELEDADRTDTGVIFSLPCNGGYIDCRLEVTVQEGITGEEECTAMGIALIPNFGGGEVFNLAQLKGRERHQEKLQDLVSFSILTILDDVPEKRYVSFRRAEVLDPAVIFTEQDHERLVTTLQLMFYEIQELFPRLVAYHEGRKEMYGAGVVSMEAASNWLN